VENIISDKLQTEDTRIKGTRTSNNLYSIEINDRIEKETTRDVVLHFLHNHHLAMFSDVEVVIEISHWGNIAMKGHYKTINEGAGLKGEYSRVDYKP